MAIVGKAADMFLYYWGLKSSELYQIQGYLGDTSGKEPVC